MMTVNLKNLKPEIQKYDSSETCYFIADVGANHDGDLTRAKELIELAAEAGADAVKFQHFNAATIVSDYGFSNLKDVKTHQSNWEKSVFEVYENASVSLDWTQDLVRTAKEVGIHFFTTPYELDLVDKMDPFMEVYKIGSGDITWIEMIEKVASKGKPYLLATGAADLVDVCRAVEAGMAYNENLTLMQCNTNYTGNLENFKYTNLNVLKTYRSMYPTIRLGLSDHTPGHAAVLGAIALGATAIEKHFTDDNTRAGPDHGFALNPKTWREMVDRSRELELALGNGVKKIEINERDTVVVQRRSLCMRCDVEKGYILKPADLVPLRPCPIGAYSPFEKDELIGKELRNDMKKGQIILTNNVRW